MITADTITDEQIRELRDALETERNAVESSYRDAFQARLMAKPGSFGVVAGDERLAALDHVRNQSNSDYLIALCALGTRISWISCRNSSKSEREEARARSVEIINARAVSS